MMAMLPFLLFDFKQIEVSQKCGAFLNFNNFRNGIKSLVII